MPSLRIGTANIKIRNKSFNAKRWQVYIYKCNACRSSTYGRATVNQFQSRSTIILISCTKES